MFILENQNSSEILKGAVETLMELLLGRTVFPKTMRINYCCVRKLENTAFGGHISR